MVKSIPRTAGNRLLEPARRIFLTSEKDESSLLPPEPSLRTREHVSKVFRKNKSEALLPKF